MAGRKVADMRHELWPKIMTHDSWHLWYYDGWLSQELCWDVSCFVVRVSQTVSWSAEAWRLSQRMESQRHWLCLLFQLHGWLYGLFKVSWTTCYMLCQVKSSVVCSVVPVGQTVNHHPCYTYTYTYTFFFAANRNRIWIAKDLDLNRMAGNTISINVIGSLIAVLLASVLAIGRPYYGPLIWGMATLPSLAHYH